MYSGSRSSETLALGPKILTPSAFNCTSWVSKALKFKLVTSVCVRLATPLVRSITEIVPSGSTE